MFDQTKLHYLIPDTKLDNCYIITKSTENSSNTTKLQGYKITWKFITLLN